MEKNKTIKIFLASSNELSDDRKKFGNFIRSLDEIYKKRGIHISVTMWEDLDAAYKGQRQQDYYNEKVRESDLFLALFYTKGGDFTIEEFDVAVDEFDKSNKQSPKIYVYFMDLPEDKKRKPNLKKFMKRLDEMGIFWNGYSIEDQLQLHFLQQLLMVENGLASLKLEGDKVTLEGMHVADIDNLPFAKSNKDYQRIIGELLSLPEEIAVSRKVAEEHPDNGYLRSELQKKQDRYNQLTEEVVRLQKTFFEMSQVSARIQHDQLGGKLREATEATESGNKEKANSLLSQIISEAESVVGGLKKLHEPVHQGIEALLLQAKTVMTEVNTPIKERIKQVQAIYAKADEWAKDSALPDDKYEGLLDDYAKFHRDYGLYKEAEPVYLRLIDLREKLYGQEHADTAASYNNIGALYNDQGDYAKALEYLRKALAICVRVLGPDHPDTAQSYNNIGLAYYNQRDYTKALEYYGKDLAICERVLGLDHPDTATSYNNIGAFYDEQGDYAKALEYYKKALDIYEQILGFDHPYTATSYNNIGGVYDSKGDYTKALEYHMKASDIRERVLGPDHPDTATSYNNIGAVYKNQGDYAKALDFYGKALYIFERVLDPDHPNTKMVRDEIEKCRSMISEHPYKSSFSRMIEKISVIFLPMNDSPMNEMISVISKFH